jgi:Uma2 family endonuclease
MPTAFRFTSKDLEAMPQFEGVRYEIIDGEMFVSTAPHWHHQFVADGIVSPLRIWSSTNHLGVTVTAPGLVFADDQDVIPDLIWISRERLAYGQDAAGHFTIAPELVVEVLSVGSDGECRDREIKLRLYSRRGESALQLIGTLISDDTRISPLLPVFPCPIASLWAPAAS